MIILGYIIILTLGSLSIIAWSFIVIIGELEGIFCTHIAYGIIGAITMLCINILRYKKEV